ncbi:monocyte differentiation antigen CD14 [Discoglossus pictus]
MKIIPSIVFLLLISQGIPWAVSSCIFDSTARRCSCSLVDLTDIRQIILCLQATSFEFQGGSFINPEDFTSHSVEMEQILAMIRVPLKKVSFSNVLLSKEFVSTFIKWVIRIPITEFAFENTTFIGQSDWQYMNKSSPNIASITFINVSSNPLFDTFSDRYFLSNWITKLEEITIRKSQLTSVPCDFTLLSKALTTLDLSENALEDGDISTTFCKGAFPNLKKLHLRQNRLMNYEVICETLSKQNNLRHLDLSQNKISFFSKSPCTWQPALILLNLSNADLTTLDNNLPNNCEVLDLSYNEFTTLNISLPKLKELYLSHNRFTTISNMGNLPLLQVLAMDWNLIESLQRGQLQYFKHLNIFMANNNPYACSCSSVNEINEIANSGLTMQYWPDGYMCESPLIHRGMLVTEVTHSFFECHKTLLIVVICFVILLICAVIIICFVKIHRSKKTDHQNSQTVNISSVHFQT